MAINTAELPRLIPTGQCWCGCGKPTGRGAFFYKGHDKIAEAALIAILYGGEVHQLLQAHGYGPQRPVIEEAVKAGAWEKCDHPGCWYRGAPASVRYHDRKYHGA